ncbi:hypothetical protein Bhyg_03157, partial [Pseudolycoriella hygida]
CFEYVRLVFDSDLSDCLSDPWTGLHLQILALESAEYRGQSHNSFVRTSFLDRTAVEIAKSDISNCI